MKAKKRFCVLAIVAVAATSLGGAWSSGSQRAAQRPASVTRWVIANGAITDTNTSLMWEAGDSAQQKLLFENALKRVQTLCLAGFYDWRLPTIDELRALSVDLRTYSPPDSALLANRATGSYWTSNTAVLAGLTLTGTVDVGSGEVSHVSTVDIGNLFRQTLGRFGSESSLPGPTAGHYSWGVRAVTKGLSPQAERIRLVQQRLKEWKQDPGPVDGEIGKKTIAALKAFQTEKGLPTNGVMDSATLDELRVVPCKETSGGRDQ
jgi:hypothetical protein